MTLYAHCSRVLLLLMIAGAAMSQEISRPDSIPAVSQIPPIDTSRVQTGEKPASSLVMTKSPALAVGLSAVLPGAGQFYNESYWKIPIVVGLGAYFAAGWIRNDQRAEDFRIQFEESKTEENPSGDGNLLVSRDFYKTQRDSFVWYFVILYVANLVDAYVDANLYDFDVGEDLSIRLLPEVGLGDYGSPGVGVVFNF